jgi:hypothetical protein
MVNEFHNGMQRCVRTREIGRRLLPVAHDCGVRHLAMEALPNDGFADGINRDRVLPPGGGYLGQPEMRALIEDALGLGWTLIAYETTDIRSPFLPGGGIDRSLVNQREEDQARNLLAALPATPLLVWCGNSHLSKAADTDWVPMGHVFKMLSGIDQFSLDQTVTIFDELGRVDALRDELVPLGGTAGKLSEDIPAVFCGTPGVDACLFSLENELV